MWANILDEQYVGLFHIRELYQPVWRIPANIRESSDVVSSDIRYYPPLKFTQSTDRSPAPTEGNRLHGPRCWLRWREQGRERHTEHVPDTLRMLHWECERHTENDRLRMCKTHWECVWTAPRSSETQQYSSPGKHISQLVCALSRTQY